MHERKLYSITNFYNIYALEKIWVEYRISKNKIDREKYNKSVQAYRDLRHGKISPKEANEIWGNVYYSRPLRGVFDHDEEYEFFLANRKLIGENLKGFLLRRLTVHDINKVMNFQNFIYENMENKDLLRNNTKKMMKSCLRKPHLTLGLFDNHKLVALSILYDPKNHQEEDLTSYLNFNTTNFKVLNYKNCMVSPNYRGHGLQVLLEKELEKHIKSKKNVLLCSTAHPNNIASISSMKKCGFNHGASINKYGLPREVYYKVIEKF